MIGIYAIFRKSDDKCVYVGESKDITRRIGQHLTNNTHIDVNSEEYYGKPIEIHETDDKKYRMEREVYWINELNPEFNEIRDGSSWMKDKPSPFRGKTFSEETLEILRQKNKGSNNPMYGKPSAMRGKPAWNRGLTKETDPRVAKYSNNISITKQKKKEKDK